MRHTYDTRAIALGRVPVGEATALIALLTEDLGLVYARAQSVRRPGAKLAAPLATLAESAVALVRGKEQWRVSGAVLAESWFVRLPGGSRASAARLVALLARLVPVESRDPRLFVLVRGALRALAEGGDGRQESIETLATLRLLAVLGLAAYDAGSVDDYARTTLDRAAAERQALIALIDAGLAASGL